MAHLRCGGDRDAGFAPQAYGSSYHLVIDRSCKERSRGEKELSTVPGRLSADAPLDAVVIGAGFGGMYMLHRLRELQLDVIAFEAGSDVGGTWYWNAYPGARCDVQSVIYSYSFDSQLQKEWEWPERYSNQGEILKYARHAADRYDLRRHIVFDTRVIGAVWEEKARCWRVKLDQGDEVLAKYLISAVGSLSAVHTPDFPGLDSFQGEWRHTGNCAAGALDTKDKRVALIGTGSSGIQAAPVIARDAAHLHVFQRTAQFSIPAQNGPLTKEGAAITSAGFAAWRAARQAEPRAFYEGTAERYWREDTLEQRLARYEELWNLGGPSFNFAYRDTMTNELANDEAAEFLHNKIRAIVRDPATAELLCPKGYPLGSKRMCVDSGYYEMFNRSNVSLHDARSDPIVQITPTGLQLASGRAIDVDTIVFATGYDAMTGAIERLNLQGRDGRRLSEVWREGPRSYLGLAVEGFPNLFIINGPGSPSVLAVVIKNNEIQADWIADFIVEARAQGVDQVDARRDYQDRWVTTCSELAANTLYPRANSWYVGANVPGKPRTFMPYIGGLERYEQVIQNARDNGYEGFVLQRPAD